MIISKKVILIYWMMFMITPVKLLAGPILVGSGAGKGEFSVVFTHKLFGEILSECIEVRCSLSDNEKQEVKPYVEYDLPNLHFLKKKELKEKEYELRGSDLFINQDRLWLNEEKTKPYDVPEAMILWLRVLSNEQLNGSIYDKMRKDLRASVLRGHVVQKKSRFEYLIIERQNEESLFQMMDSTGQSFLLNDLISSKIQCEKGSPKGLSFISPAFRTHPGSEIVRLSTIIDYTCGETPQRRFTDILAGLKRVGEKTFVFDPDTLEIYIEGMVSQ